MLMTMTGVHRLLSLVGDNVVFERPRGYTVWAVGLGGRGSRGSRAVGNILCRSGARFMSTNLTLLRLKRGVEILGFFLLSFLVRRPLVLKPCIEGLGRPLYERVCETKRGGIRGTITQAGYKPNPRQKKYAGDGMKRD